MNLIIMFIYIAILIKIIYIFGDTEGNILEI